MKESSDFCFWWLSELSLWNWACSSRLPRAEEETERWEWAMESLLDERESRELPTSTAMLLRSERSD